MPSPTPERWQEIERVLDQALAPEARAPFLVETCSGDPELRADVERLLRASETADKYRVREANLLCYRAQSIRRLQIVNDLS